MNCPNPGCNCPMTANDTSYSYSEYYTCSKCGTAVIIIWGNK